MSEKNLYAIVQFSVDESFSEIPTNWIQRNDENDGLICWWPNTKNISSLIENRAEPDMKSWSIFDIMVIKYCSSLASARKSAADAHYTTTDDEKCDRGQRKLKKNKHYFFEEKHDEKDYADDSNDEEGNVCDKENYDNEKNKSIKHLKQSINRPVFNPMPEYKSQKLDNCCQSVNTSKSILKNLHFFASKNTDIEISSSRTNINKCSSNERAVKETPYPDKSSPFVMDIESIPILEVPAVQDVYNILERIETGLNKVIRANVTTNFELMSTSKRLCKLESRLRNNAELTENDMKQMVLKIGGNTPRNSIHRALERIISNKCTISYSWKGVRSNYKICNLTFIKNIRDTICSVHSDLTEAEFDITTAEWFRFAKQRAAREEKRNDL